MSGNATAEERQFCAVLEQLAASTDGWRGSAGADFVELMSEVLRRKAARISAEAGASGVMADPSDVVSEAVMVVDGPPGVTLSANVRRILAMDRPLGYVVAAVSTNLSRAVLSERMGVATRQVRSGLAPVTHLEDLRAPSGADFLEQREVAVAWSRAPETVNAVLSPVSRQFMGILVGRFQVQASSVRIALEVAVDVALADDSGVGMTRATTRRRLARFCSESDEMIRAGLTRRQVRAMGWLLFGTERHPEWSLLAECARAIRDGVTPSVTAWQALHARELQRPRRMRARTSSPNRQPALFDADEPTRRSQLSLRSA